MLSSPNEHRGTRPRWWAILIGAGLVLVLGAIAFVALQRASGRRAYAAQITADRIAGRMSTVDDFVARAPAVDPAVQQAWTTWSDAASASWTMPTYDQAGWDRWIVGAGPRPETIVRIVEERRATMSPALELLRGGVLLSGYGWAATDLPPGRRTVADVTRLHLPNLLVLRDHATWLAYAAVLADDPTAHLGDLTRLLAAMDHPATLIDAMMMLMVAGVRDNAHLELAMRGTLPDQASVRFLAEPPRSLERLAAAYAGDRALYLPRGPPGSELAMGSPRLCDIDLCRLVSLADAAAVDVRCAGSRRGRFAPCALCRPPESAA